MDFLGRTKELQVLEREHSRKGGFVVVYGRRRVGKTTLIKEFIKGKDALYFLASNESAQLNMQRFARDVAAFAGKLELAEATYSDWRTIFRLFADCRKSRKKVLVIDELPYLIQADPALPSVLQYAWDEILSDAKVTLILCGLHTHMMLSEVLSRESPLYGRRTAQIKLHPLTFAEMQKGFGGFAFSGQLAIYAICGGVPKYLEFFNTSKNISETIAHNALETSGFLYDEPRYLLAQDTRSPINHYSLLHTIAQGNHKPSDIANRMQRGQNDISPYLKTLEELGYIERRVPATEKNPDRSKMGLYFISDPLFKFWFTYVQAFEGELELGNKLPSLDAIKRTFDSNFLPFTFEEISRQTLAELCASGQINFSPKRIGAFWDRKGTTAIDVCAPESQSSRLLLGECKLHTRKAFSLSEYLAFTEKCERAFPGQNQVRVLFSQTGFSSDLAKEAESQQVYLVDQCKLV